MVDVCEFCGVTNVTIDKEMVTRTFQGKEYTFLGIQSRCIQCDSLVYDDDVQTYNLNELLKLASGGNVTAFYNLKFIFKNVGYEVEYIPPSSSKILRYDDMYNAYRDTDTDLRNVFENVEKFMKHTNKQTLEFTYHRCSVNKNMYQVCVRVSSENDEGETDELANIYIDYENIIAYIS